MTGLRILIVEDLEDDYQLLVRALARGGLEVETTRVEDVIEMEKALDEGRWDVVVCDHALPRFSPSAALALLRERELDIPLIVVSARIGEEKAVEILRAGARDFVVKSHLARLCPAVTREVREARERAQHRQAEEALKDVELRLARSQKLEAVGRLAGGVAHDFNNILTVIRGYTEMVLSGPPVSDDTRAKLQQVLHSTDRAAEIVDQLLAIGRRQMTTPQILGINDVIMDTEHMLQRLVSPEVDLRISVANDLGRVRADSSQLVQILMNLVVNANLAMPGGGVVTIGTRNMELDEVYVAENPEVRPGEYVLLSVSDTGVGMSETVVSRAFEPFFTTREEGEGNGLGLSTVYGIVKQAGGTTYAYSEPGRGTTIKVYLPRVRDAADPLPDDPSTEPILEGSETLLLVEDDALVRAYAESTLLRFGYRVLTAADPEEALQTLETHADEVALLVSDVVMPKMSGFELAAKALERVSRLRVLHISGYSDDAVTLHGALDSSDAFLQKPFTMLDLAQAVRRVLDQPPRR